MKTIPTVTIITTIIYFFSGCQTTQTPTPTQNATLNNISKSTAAKKKSYYLQEQLDDFLENDWKKKTQHFQEQQVVQEKKEGGFLQHYVDKASYYSKHSEDSNSTSHVEELDTLPAIGSSSKRR